MSDDECPHGLDASWCSLCKAAAADRSPAARRSGPGRSAPFGRGGSSGPAAKPSGTRPRMSPVRSTGSVTNSRASAFRSSLPLTPATALARLRPALFHASSYGAWDSISASGLRTAAKLAADAGRTPPAGLRETSVEVALETGTAHLRDQRLLLRSRIESHLDGIGLAEWMGILDERVHLFARQKDLTAMLTRYQAEGQDLIVFDTARTLAAAGDRVEVATVVSGSPEPWATCHCRGRDTFIPLPLFEDAVGDIEEVTVVGGLEDVGSLVNRVVRYHPDRTTEVVWERA